MCKIVYLSIYNHTEEYAKMKQLQEGYLTFLKSQGVYIDFFFVMFDKLDTDFLFDEKTSTLYIQGEESYIPGILNKTIKAMDIITHQLKIEYDFLFRTNISTFIHYKQALHILSQFKNPTHTHYYIGPFLQIDWINPKDGVSQTHEGKIFALGTCIILSKATVQHLLHGKHLLSYDVIDDVSIGLYLTTEVSNIKIIPINEQYCWNDSLLINLSHICYKNNHYKDNRQLDTGRLEKIVNLFISEHIHMV